MITYLNEATRNLLKQHEAAFRAKWPAFQADKIVGTCIDMFHQDPQHQRKLLADPKNLPYRTEISIGDIRISLRVNGCFDAKGELVGHALEWRDVSNDALLETLEKTQAVIEFRLDGTVITANGNFLKLLGYTLDKSAASIIRCSSSPASATRRNTSPSGKAFAAGKASHTRTITWPRAARKYWLQTSYNPILGANGKPYKIVKFA